MKKRCLLTGGSGLIGSRLIEMIASRWQIYQTTRNKEDAKNDTSFYYCDFGGQWHTDDLPTNVDTVVHLAQTEHFRDFPSKAEDIFQINVGSVIKLLEYARRANASTFVLASSGGVYGFGNQAFAEDSPVHIHNGLGYYQSTKLCSEVLAESYMPFMNIIILRFFFVYGPGQRNTMFIPRMIQSVKEGKSIELQGEKGILVNPVYVDDAALAVSKAMELTDSHIINVGGSEVVSIKEIAETIGKQVGAAPQYTVKTDETPGNLIGDIQKMKKLLCMPKVSLQEGVFRYLQHGASGRCE